MSQVSWFRTFSGCVALAATAWVVPAAAQEGGLEEVVVNANRVAEDLQSTPVAVTALDAEEIELRNIRRIDDIGNGVPNLVIRENTGLSNGATIFLRGIGEDDSRIGADPAVGIYIDDQYYGRQLGGMLDLIDVERIEVLRGPQGTLYGRNANGGAVKIYTRKPGDETELKGSVTTGDYGALEAKISASGKLWENFTGLVSYGHKERDGFYKGPNVPDSLGEVDKDFFLVALDYVTRADWRISTKLDYTSDNSDPNFSVPAGTFHTLSGPVLLPASFGNPALTDGNLLNNTDMLGINVTLDGTVGGKPFKSITGYRNTKNDLVTAIRFYYTQDVEYATLSQEFQLTDATPDDAVSWVTGIYVYRESADQDTFFLFAPSALDIETTSVAGFGQIDLDFDNPWSLTLGARWTREEKKADGQVLSFNGTIEQLRGERRGDSNIDVRMVLEREFGEDAMVYGSFTTGTKSFGWSSDDFGFVDTEEVRAFELGVRSQAWDNTLRLNVTAFFNDYTDLQINGTTATSAFSRANAGDVETRGIEVEANWLLFDALRLDASIGWQDGEYVSVDPRALRAFNAPTVAVAQMRELKNLPEVTARFGAVYDLDLEQAGNLSVSADWNFQSSSWTLLANSPANALRGDTRILNARIGWTSAGDRYSLSLWGRNLGDEEYIASASGPTVFPGAPRTAGLTFGYAYR